MDIDLLDVRPISGALGAEIHGVDVSRDLDDDVAAAIRRVLLDHCVVFFHDQHLTPEQQKAFARRFGKIFVHPNFRGADPEIVEVVRHPGDLAVIGELWHSDTTMVAEPPMGAILYGIDVPPFGGDTLFANQYLAYERLSDGMKKMLDGLRAVHSDRYVAGPAVGRNARMSTKLRDDMEWHETESLHPVVRTHPETRRKALFVNHSYTIRFEGMTEAESKPLLEFLMEHGNRPEFTCRFRWRQGSIAFWDNRCTKHLAINDTGPFGRRMRRVQLCGDRPY
jgi:taurine dioxygenase